MRSNFLTTCTNSYTRKKVASRSQLYADPKGRSMVEMLGVLAIVGVLSVGAIAGYSKAMTKYKLNKQAESFNAFINNAIKIKPDLERAFKGSAFYTSFFYKAGLIPDGMEYDKSIDRIRDVFNNYTMIYYSTSLGYDYIDYVSITTLQRSGRKLTSRDREICNNMVTVAKENAANLATLELRSHSSNESPYTYKRLTGDIYAGSDRGKPLRSVTLQDIDEFCASCDSEKSCELIIYYK